MHEPVSSPISSNEAHSCSPPHRISFFLSFAGILLFAIVYLLWKARARCFGASLFSSSDLGSGGGSSTHLSASKFDLDYWLKQVDLREARDADRYRGGLSTYLKLPTEEPRDSHAATATWIVDTWRHWRLTQYRQQRPLFQTHVDAANVPYRRPRRHFLYRLLHRLLTPPDHRGSFLIEHSSSIIAEMRPSLIENQFLPSPASLEIQPRRVASWPRLKSSEFHTGPTMSGLQTQLARKHLLERATNHVFEI